MGRPRKVTNNPYLSEFIDLVGEPLPQWLDDVLYGAGRLHEGSNTVIPLTTLRKLFQSLQTFTVPNIQCSLSRLRVAMGDEPVGERYCQSVLRSLESSIKSIDYHLERGKTF